MGMTRLTAAVASAAAAMLLSGCDSQHGNAVNPALSAAATFPREAVDNHAVLRPPGSRIPRDLYVTVWPTNLEIFANKGDKEIRTIHTRFVVLSEFLDALGDLYVDESNDTAVRVAEYGPGKKRPDFIYTAGLQSEAYSVAVDGNQHVFAGTVDGQIIMYNHRVNAVAASCTFNGYAVAGLAVDTPGDVFADLVSSTKGAELVYIPYDLANCAYAEVLPVKVDSFVWGIALDNQFNLVVADGSQVLVIPDPYDYVKRTIGSGFTEAINVHLNRDDSTAFVTDHSSDTVTKVNYLTGANVKVLSIGSGSNDGPFDAVDWPNDVVQ